MRKFSKYFLFFLVLATFTLGLISLVPIVSYKIYSIKKTTYKSDLVKKLTNLPNYEKIDWASKHFNERIELSSDYNSYIGWKRNEYNGETITVNKDGFRKTINHKNNNDSQNFLFFGGSSMWGYGANDENTIPSIFSKKKKFNSYNFAQDSYVIRQSSNALINFYNINTDKKNKNVIFSFEGANDVVIKCANGLNKYSHEIKLKEYYKNKDEIKNKSLSFSHFILPFETLLKKYRIRKTENQNLISENKCITNELYADQIVDSIILSWKNFDDIAKNNGDRFIALLQPVLFLSDVRKDYLKEIKTAQKNSNLEKIFLILYPKIIEKMKDTDIEFYDLTYIFDETSEDYIYVDWVHFSPNGSDIITDELIRFLN